jgi:4-hydroxybenzoate polyprenyltransferase
LLFYGGAVILTAAAGYGLNWPFWLGLVTYTGSLLWQIYRLDIHNSDRCLQLFRFNRVTGFALLFGITGSALIV